MSISKQSIDIIKATAPVVAPHAKDITTLFYKKMLGRHPELFQYFNKANNGGGRQPQALADAVVAYASNIDNLGVLGPAVSLMAVKHCALQVQPEHYPIVHDNLMEAVGETLGAAVTAEVAAGWSEAVNALAGILISAEKDLYAAAAAREGGWMGWRDFQLASKEDHGHGVATFRFAAADGYAGGFGFTPGQYLTLDMGLKDEEGDVVAPRHYTITSAPGEPFLECTVKALEGGRVSSALHELAVGGTVRLSPPFGVYTPPETTEDDEGVVMLSAGIGVTPHYALHRAGVPTASVVHVDHSVAHNPFHDYFVSSCPAYRFIDTSVEGRPDLGSLVQSMDSSVEGGLSGKTVLVCAPTAFMQAVVPELKTKGAKVVYENFGPRTQA
jgi:nitric oxide dioxygenase